MKLEHAEGYMFEQVPDCPDPFEQYAHPFAALDMMGTRAYPAIEAILWSPSRVGFLCDYVKALRSLPGPQSAPPAANDELAELDPAAFIEEKIPAELLRAIETIAAEGLVPKAREIAPEQVAAILRNPEALLHAHLNIAASSSVYWDHFEPSKPIPPPIRVLVLATHAVDWASGVARRPAFWLAAAAAIILFVLWWPGNRVPPGKEDPVAAVSRQLDVTREELLLATQELAGAKGQLDVVVRESAVTKRA
ncbi:MAG: hypothetical protein ABIK89_25055, partial [Planctomycetota bacterium]